MTILLFIYPCLLFPANGLILFIRWSPRRDGEVASIAIRPEVIAGNGRKGERYHGDIRCVSARQRAGRARASRRREDTGASAFTRAHVRAGCNHVIVQEAATYYIIVYHYCTVPEMIATDRTVRVL